MKTRRIATQGRPDYHTLDGPFRGPIRRTAANLATRSVLFCSVLFCPVHTLGCHTWTARFSQKTHAEPPHTDGPNLKRFIQVPHSQIPNSIPVNSISCIKSSYHAILHKFKRLFDIHNMQFIHQIKKKDYLPQSMHFFVLFVKRPGTRTCCRVAVHCCLYVSSYFDTWI